MRKGGRNQFQVFDMRLEELVGHERSERHATTDPNGNATHDKQHRNKSGSIW